jgi:phosphonate transport system ATP-binding protein
MSAGKSACSTSEPAGVSTIVDFAGERLGYRDAVVLDDVRLSIAAGERIALVGESGAGKTTLLRAILERCAARAAYIPQDLGLVQALTVFHNVYMGRLHTRHTLRNLRNLLLPAKPEVAAIGAVLDRLRMADKLFSPVGALSGGQQQRTAFGRALYHPGDVLLGDEPVSAVDEHQAREILGTAASAKATLVVAMHDRALALETADRVVGLRDGRIALDAPTAGMTPGDLDALYRS